jgi:hypothetical protein
LFQPKVTAEEMHFQNTGYLPHALHNHPKILPLSVRLDTSIYGMIKVKRMKNG